MLTNIEADHLLTLTTDRLLMLMDQSSGDLPVTPLTVKAQLDGLITATYNLARILQQERSERQRELLDAQTWDRSRKEHRP